MPRSVDDRDWTGQEVAVLAMTGRFPGAPGVEELWQRLRRGDELIRRFSSEELRTSGIPEEEYEHPNYVPARACLDGTDRFDAGFFDLTPREAEILDPQHRLFLECAHETLERAGYDPAQLEDRVGVFAGASISSYLLYHLWTRPDLLAAVGSYALLLANDKDYLPTRVSYKLDLRGPSVLVQTACSTSLVAVHLACQSLLNGECEMALAGGVSLTFPKVRGYVYEEGSILSPDGHCRPFDQRAAGTVNGDGLGIVLLKRLEDALADRDPIRAVILGSAINNDGASKVGFTAPSVAGQASVISAAQYMAEVEAGTVGYVEAHGTGTRLGDPIEVAALVEAFETSTDQRGFCHLGSIKSNLGHLDTAAGVTGLIKAVKSLEEGEIPANLHFESPQDDLDLERTPFVISAETVPWPATGRPRRAGVSSFGIGGTNAHAVLEQAPERGESGPSRRHQIVLLSARTAGALERAQERLIEAFEDPRKDSAAASVPSLQGTPLADVAYTLMVGRRSYEYRRQWVIDSETERPADVLRQAGRGRAAIHRGTSPPVVFLFPGQGAQYPGMARELAKRETVFREAIDHCAESLDALCGLDLKTLIWPSALDSEAAARLQRTEMAQPALFAVEYALAQQLNAWGIAPDAMVGHSLGEYAAACLAGVFTLEDALRLVVARGRAMQAMPGGAMLSVPLGAGDLAPRLPSDLEIAADNAPSLCVVSGPSAAVQALAQTLQLEGIDARTLHTSHAFHSRSMDAALPEFRAVLGTVDLQPPERRFLSGVSGDWITAEEAVDPEYWLRQLRQTVRFADGCDRLLAEPESVFLEVGPGQSLGRLLRAQKQFTPSRSVSALLPSANSPRSSEASVLDALGRLWLAGVRPDWVKFFGDEVRHRIELPTYPFERRSHWVERRILPEALPEDDTAGGDTASIPAASNVEDRRRLSEADDRAFLTSTYVAPRTVMEETVAEIWCELIGVPRPGIHDDFFELGGHSLLATQVLSRLRDRLGATIELPAFLASPTISALAAQLSDQASVKGSEAAVRDWTIERVDRGQALALSFSQERLWFLDQLEADSPAYNISFALELRGALDVEALRWSFGRVEARHEALRTFFVGEDDRPRQCLAVPGELSVWVADLRELDAAQQTAEIERQISVDALRPFALRQRPLFRVGLLWAAAERHILLVSFHHIICDGWSFGIIARDIEHFYSLARRTPPGHVNPPDLPGLPDLAVQYADFASWQRQALSASAQDRQIAYWRRQLADPPLHLNLPVDRDRQTTDPQGSLFRLAFNEELRQSLDSWAKRSGATLYMTLLTAWSVALHTWSQAEDLVIGSPIAGRTHPQTEAMVGFFVNTLALRCRLDGDPTVDDLLQRVRTLTLEAYAHQDLPFEQVVASLRLDRDTGRYPLFRVWFVLQNTPNRVLDLPGIEVESVPPKRLAVRHDLKLDLTEEAEGLSGFFEYRTALFDRSTIAAMAERLRAVLEGIVRHPTVRLSELTAELRAADEAHWAATRKALKKKSLGKLRRARRPVTNQN